MVKKKAAVDNIWKLIYSCLHTKDLITADIDKEYKDLDKDLENYYKLASREHYSKIPIKKLEELSKEYWKKLITYVCNDLTTKIENRKTKGQDFSTIKFQLKKISDDVKLEYFKIEVYDNLYNSDVLQFGEQIGSLIDIEEYDDRRYKKGIKIGFILGIAASVIATSI